MRQRKLIRYSFPLIVLIGVYFAGPQPSKPTFSPALPVVPSEPLQLERYVSAEDQKHKIKPHNEAEIVWVDSSKSKTEYVVLYLHGFSASKMEGDPIHRNFAKEFGCNLYMPRLADHGVDTTETLLQFTADRFWESGKQALAIAKQLGDKVILVGTSTGSTLALKLAADYPQDVYALINLSPNIAINNGAAFLLNNPWGLYIARAVMGGKYRVTGATEEHARYWNKKYRLESAVELQEFIERTMTEETFKKITQPSLTLYYYKNETEQDPEVRVDAMLAMNEKLSTPPNMKKTVALPKTGAHVIGSSLTSGDVNGVYEQMKSFAVETLHLKSVTSR
jgi:esterase/lipase